MLDVGWPHHEDNSDLQRKVRARDGVGTGVVAFAGAWSRWSV